MAVSVAEWVRQLAAVTLVEMDKFK
jgi:hypothetical protein